MTKTELEQAQKRIVNRFFAKGLLDAAESIMESGNVDDSALSLARISLEGIIRRHEKIGYEIPSEKIPVR